MILSVKRTAWMFVLTITTGHPKLKGDNEMSTVPCYDCFVLVIRTDSYAGNFEREMCAYMTGECGECGVGDEEARIFQDECPENYEFEDLVTSFPDEHGCHRPATIWGSNCNDMAIFFDSRPTDDQLSLMRDRARKFAAATDPRDRGHSHITISGFELMEYLVKHTENKVLSWTGDE